MTHAILPEPVYIDTQTALAQLADSLLHERLIGVDIEANNQYAYQERVCLIQISTRSADYIVDPLALTDLSALAPVMDSAQVEKIFHACEYDITSLKRDFGFHFQNIFDTMMAARICGFNVLSLSGLLERFAGIHLDKSHQLDNWALRPLPPDSIRYAQMDTHFLPLLRDEFHNELQHRNRLDEARENFAHFCHLPAATPRAFDPDFFWKLGQPNYLRPRELAMLRELCELRESIAQREDQPPYRVFSNNTLLDLARTAPTNAIALSRIDGVSPAQIRKHGAEIIAAMRRGKQAPLPKDRHDYRPPPEPISQRYTALTQWRTEHAHQRGVDADIILSRQALWDLAYQAPTTLEALERIKGIGPWRLHTYGEELLAVIRSTNHEESS